MMRKGPAGIEGFFEPKSVAVAGVSGDPDKLGSIIFANLLENQKNGLLKASVYALNPARDRIGDQPCYPDVKSLPTTPELLIVSVPESQTLALIREAAEAGVKASIIVTSGYAEAGRADVEKEIGRVAAARGMRVLGPNTIGVVDTWSGVDSLFLRPTKTLPDGRQVASMLKPIKGEIAVISQSGHLAEAVSEELAASGVGMRALVGTGNQVDVSVEDVIRYFADDKHTKVIAVYLEGVRDGRGFLEAAEYATTRKPVVVFKVGKTGVGARAALTHTASLVGDYAVYRAAFRQAGVIEASSLQELMDYAVALLMLPRSSGKRTVVVTNAGGVGAIAADEAERSGLRVEQLAEGSQKRLRSRFGGAAFLANASLRNPVDLTATAPTGDFVDVTAAVLGLSEVDAGVVLPTHQTPAIEPDIASRLSRAVLDSRKPVCVCVVGNSELARRIHLEFTSSGIPSFPTPERAVRALAAAVTCSSQKTVVRKPKFRVKTALRFGSKRGLLQPNDASRLLRAYGLAEPRSFVVRSPDDLRRMRGVGFPVVCKLLSPDLVHKTDVGGVLVGVENADDAQLALARFRRLAGQRRIRFGGMLVQEMVGGGTELIVGGTRDPIFGPVVAVGLGGTYAELMHEYALALAPVTVGEARDLIGQSKLGRVLEGYRGGLKVETDRVSRAVSQFSRILSEQPSIGELEINPLMVAKGRVLAVDTRVVLDSRAP
jgi:acetyltransferase